jgi:sucrose phosphorylase
MNELDKVKQLLNNIYGDETGELALKRIAALIEKFPVKERKKETYFSQEEVVLITYGDSLHKEGQRPLATLHEFADHYLKGAISTIHFLPFFPYSSDDGFSVMDFFEINPELGTWKEVSAIGQDFELMFDYVVNHFSSKGQWFQNYLESNEGFEEFAIDVDPSTPSVPIKLILILKAWMCSKK